VGRSNWPLEGYFQGKIAGLYTVDALLSEAEISKISRKMYRGDETLQVCQTCAGNTSSLQGSLSEAECECAPGTYKSVSEADKRAISLDSESTQLSTMANRGLVLFTDTAVFNSTAGPTGSKGAVTFNRTLSQHIDSGTHTFNIASNGGFTAVVLVKFTSAVGTWEKFFDFFNIPGKDNLLLSRSASSSELF